MSRESKNKHEKNHNVILAEWGLVPWIPKAPKADTIQNGDEVNVRRKNIILSNFVSFTDVTMQLRYMKTLMNPQVRNCLRDVL